MGISFSGNIFDTEILAGDFRFTGILVSVGFTVSGSFSATFTAAFDFCATCKMFRFQVNISIIKATGVQISIGIVPGGGHEMKKL